MEQDKKLPVGENVVLVVLPPGLLDGLPEDDQRAIRAIVGKPVMLVGYDEDGRAELVFENPFHVETSYWHTHSIWVAPDFIKRYQP